MGAYFIVSELNDANAEASVVDEPTQQSLLLTLLRTVENSPEDRLFPLKPNQHERVILPANLKCVEDPTYAREHGLTSANV